MKKAYCPHIEGLHMPDLITFSKRYPQVLEYLPAEEEMIKAGREWITNMLYTLKPEEFQALVRSKEQDRRDKMDAIQQNNVSFRHVLAIRFKSIQPLLPKWAQPSR